MIVRSNIGHALLRVEFCKNIGLFERDVRFGGSFSVGPLAPQLQLE